MNALEHALKKARQTKSVCAVTRRGTGRGYETREPIDVLAHPDLAVLADEIERLRAALKEILANTSAPHIARIVRTALYVRKGMEKGT